MKKELLNAVVPTGFEPVTQGFSVFLSEKVTFLKTDLAPFPKRFADWNQRRKIFCNLFVTHFAKQPKHHI
ncbi:hypothetical protein [Olivibacter sp. XZL3]|uniref:hypothetical protein n=1 Tax=Olivibacter sp. XZL3 TaxID=1735116 RepID=UPI001064BA64|nr:hypothetical protein [Olivibacter sp. XZL3]